MSIPQNFVAVKYNGYELDESKENFSLRSSNVQIDLLLLNYQFSQKETVFNVLTKIENDTFLKFYKQPYGTPVFEKQFKVFFDGKLFAYLYCLPRNKKIDEDLVQIKVSNNALYDFSRKKIKSILLEISTKLELTYKNISRLDLATDLVNENDFFQNLIRTMLVNKFKIKGGKKQMSGYFNMQLSKGLFDFKGFAIGTKKNYRMLRIYNKTLEMQEVKQKSHISNFWKRQELEGEIWRFEMSYNQTYLDKCKISLDDALSFTDQLKNFHLDSIDKQFSIKKDTGKTEINKEPDLLSLNFINTFNHPPETNEYIVKKDKKNDIYNSQLSAKREVKTLFRLYYKTGYIPFYDGLLQVIKEHDLQQFFEDKKEYYINEFELLTINENAKQRLTEIERQRNSARFKSFIFDGIPNLQGYETRV